MIVGLILVVLFVLHALRTDHALLDLRLFKTRAFAAAAGVTTLFGAAMFGAMLLFPLYYQVVRGQSALDAGSLMAPQGLGAAVMMPISGRIVDRGAAGKVVLCGLPLVALGYLTYTQLGADTSYALLAGSLFVAGLGTGATMMPAMSAAYQTLNHAQVPRATTTLNILMRVGGSIGTALFAVVLQHQIRRQRRRRHRRRRRWRGRPRRDRRDPRGVARQSRPRARRRLRAHLLVAGRAAAGRDRPALLLPRRKPSAPPAAPPASATPQEPVAQA